MIADPLEERCRVRSCLNLESGGKGRAKLKKDWRMQWGYGEQDT